MQSGLVYSEVRVGGRMEGTSQTGLHSPKKPEVSQQRQQANWWRVNSVSQSEVTQYLIYRPIRF